MKTEQEKAKAYDIALDKAKDYHKQLLDEDNPEWASEIEKIFPELKEKESEDERVREILIGYFNRYKVQEACGIKTFCGIPTDDILAWLEKQKPVWSEEEDETVLNNLIYALANDRIGNNRDGYVNWLKSLKDRVGCEVNCTTKKAWNEEDERLRRKLIDLIYAASYCDERENLSDWLKTIKDRVQPKQEWSKEDEINRDLIYNALNHVYDIEHNRNLCVWLNTRCGQPIYRDL